MRLLPKLFFCLVAIVWEWKYAVGMVTNKQKGKLDLIHENLLKNDVKVNMTVIAIYGSYGSEFRYYKWYIP